MRPNGRRAPITPEERPAAAFVSLVLYALAGAALAGTTHLTRSADRHDSALTVLAVVIVAMAPLAFAI